jgi:hypothetical protein
VTQRLAAYGLLQQPQPPQVDHSFQVPPPQFQTSTAQLQFGGEDVKSGTEDESG